jgi:hypothetical protein
MLKSCETCSSHTSNYPSEYLCEGGVTPEKCEYYDTLTWVCPHCKAEYLVDCPDICERCELSMTTLAEARRLEDEE